MMCCFKDVCFAMMASIGLLVKGDCNEHFSGIKRLKKYILFFILQN